MIAVAIIVLAIILAFLLFRPRLVRPRSRRRQDDSGTNSGSFPMETGFSDDAHAEDPRFEAGGGDFGGAGASESWDSDDGDGGGDGGGGDD